MGEREKFEHKRPYSTEISHDSRIYGIRMAELAIRGIDIAHIDTVRRHDEDAYTDEVID